MSQLCTLRLILRALVLGAAASGFAQQPKAPPADTAPSADEKQIREGVVALVEQFNAHEADALTALFAPHARITFRDGTEVNGSDEIKQSFSVVVKT